MVYILGGWQSDLSRKRAREGLAAVDLEPGDIQCGQVGNFVDDLFAGQGLLGAFLNRRLTGAETLDTDPMAIEVRASLARDPKALEQGMANTLGAATISTNR